jgi:hypothetical protein
VTWGEDGLPAELPDGFVHLVYGGGGFIGVMLDGHTGYVYFIDPDMDHIAVSFGAPSVEDWLERELDASRSVRSRYYPREKLATILAAEGQNMEELVQVPRSVTQDTRLDSSDLTPSTLRTKQETARPRKENLGTEEPNPSG